MDNQGKIQLLTKLRHRINSDINLTNTNLNIIANHSNKLDIRTRNSIEVCKMIISNLEAELETLFSISMYSSEIPLEILDVGDIISDRCKNQAPAFSHRNINLISNIEQDLIIESSFRLLKAIFSNLVLNAAQYTTSGGQISVDCFENTKGIVVSIKNKFNVGFKFPKPLLLVEQTLDEGILEEISKKSNATGLLAVDQWVKALGGEFLIKILPISSDEEQLIYQFEAIVILKTIEK